MKIFLISTIKYLSKFLFSTKKYLSKLLNSTFTYLMDEHVSRIHGNRTS